MEEFDDFFVLDADALQKGWGADEQYWFSLKDYKIRNHYEFADDERPDDADEAQYMRSIGFIPYFRVSRYEMAKAYIAAVGSHKLNAKLNALENESDYIEAFWKYFNAYPHLSEGYEEFQTNFLLKTAIDWCNDNGINFIVK